MTDFEQLSYASSPATAFSQGRSIQRQIPFPSQPGSLSTMPILLLKKEDRRNTRGKFFRSLHCSLVWLTDVKNLEVRPKDKCKGHIPFIFIDCATQTTLFLFVIGLNRGNATLLTRSKNQINSYLIARLFPRYKQ